jgi:subtilase family serine protease
MTRRPLPVLATLTVLAAGLAVVPLTSSASAAAPKLVDKRVCAVPVPGFAACHAHVRSVMRPDGTVRPHATTTRTSGYISSDLKAAYNLPAGTTTTTVAVVDAYASPNAAADLAAYRSQTGLPPLAAGQFTQVNQSGGSIGTVPADVGWGQEEMLDLEMVSAICPTCNILYVGGNSASFNDLAAAVNTAVAKGATVVSNSYGAPEFSSETTFASAYDHPGVAITVSSGDNGYGVEAPAAFNTVVAVGGTNLQRANNARGWTETAWTGAGSGCSALIPQKSWQSGRPSGCSRRAVADVSAVADPNTGVAVYDSYGSTGGANWYVFGGTSVAAPIIGAVYALSGNTAGYPAQLAYTTSGGLWDVVSGSNVKGRCRAGNLCTATTGYDGPTGMGTPKGVTAF